MTMSSATRAAPRPASAAPVSAAVQAGDGGRDYADVKVGRARIVAYECLHPDGASEVIVEIEPPTGDGELRVYVGDGLVALCGATTGERPPHRPESATTA